MPEITPCLSVLEREMEWEKKKRIEVSQSGTG